MAIIMSISVNCLTNQSEGNVFVRDQSRNMLLPNPAILPIISIQQYINKPSSLFSFADENVPKSLTSCLYSLGPTIKMLHSLKTGYSVEK